MNLLLTGAYKYGEEQLKEIKKLGYDITYIADERIPLKEQGINPGEFDAVVCNGLFLYNDIKEFEKLKFVQLTSAGLDRVPLEEIDKRGIKLFNARGVYSIPMAEFALSGVLQLYKQSRFFAENQKLKKWEKNRNLLELYGKTVCIVGCGSVGTECAKRFGAFGCNVTGVDVAPYENDAYGEMFALGEIGEALACSDIVVLTLPLTEETRRLFDEKMFGKMKKGAAIVNISRGGVIDTIALEKALSERLSGAVLDVFCEEPLSCDSPLWDMENVIITPHNSFVGEGNSERLFEVIFNNLKDWIGK